MKLRGKFYSILTGGVYRVLNINFQNRKITGINSNEELTFDFNDVVWLESTEIKEGKKFIYTDDYIIAKKDNSVVMTGIVKKRADGSFALVNKNSGQVMPLLQLQYEGAKLINLQNHKIYFARKNNKTKEK
ncbi:hypothetical protein [Fusobacterium nucleatum]|uniref:YopX protein domain-containing protein n=1 Tax=Fusobacterium nucleatum TaxID=851 RepID=A0A133NQT3_FUSNU|nr:hypothetical protein [Fusobacterium nucleatum]KXA18652.1 hypothetical protein HMPREF3221_01703 [Fusobacterium nucleatum]